MYRKYWVLPLVAVVAVVALVVGLRPHDSIVRVTADDTGTTVILHVGDTLEVALSGNPTTGYGWEVAPDGTGILVLDGEPTYTSDSALVGAGGTYVFSFAAQAEGEADVDLVYRRAWEEGVAPVDTFAAHIIVR